ncbi:MAG TPA: CBS domain-containing protein [Candidatus Limnocylindrales bacterium]|nr:CBS domain-containing protein [Candidatus Limnocylindrales bacterium]
MNATNPMPTATPDLESLCVADVMTIDPVVVRSDASIASAENLLSAYRISGLPVVDDGGHLVGVISKTDLVPDGSPGVEAVIRANGKCLRVGELMSSPPVTVAMTATLVEAARVMHEARVHRLVAVDERGRPIGVLSASDYVAVIAEG